MNQDNKKSNKKSKIYIAILIILLVIIIAIMATIMIMKNKQDSDNKKMAYTELIKNINEQAIEKIEMKVGSTTVKVKLEEKRSGD